MMEKERIKNMREIMIITISHELYKNKECGSFSLFLYKKNPHYKRCLLSEYRTSFGSKGGQLFFNQEKAKEICKFFNPSIKTRCNYPGNYSRDKKIRDLEKQLGILRNKNVKLNNKDA